MISSPLFIMVAESMVIFAPMLQLGCRSASMTVTLRSSSVVLPKKGPPEAVRMSFLSALFLGAPCKHWKIALCSLSTGKSRTPFSRTASVTRSPPATKVSLLASAMSFFACTAAKVGCRPTMPTTALTTSSADSIVAAAIKPSMPPSTCVSVSFMLSRSCFARNSS